MRDSGKNAGQFVRRPVREMQNRTKDLTRRRLREQNLRQRRRREIFGGDRIELRVFSGIKVGGDSVQINGQHVQNTHPSKSRRVPHIYDFRPQQPSFDRYADWRRIRIYLGVVRYAN